MDKKKPKYISPEEALLKLQRYCVYQDRCHKEVRTKLIDLGIYGDTLEEIIVELIKDNFLNEERFARSYARGKFKIKKWGKIRIRRELKLRGISAYCLKKAMEEIEEKEYVNTILALIEKKDKTLREKDLYKRQTKIGQYVIGRGFESFLVWDLLKEYMKCRMSDER
ncbi:MAG TPA: RecX family transcriptional regulator [Saprospiraceae bacterium]|nr:RecX family transcriptional regulator [Saprospiraceae bacterium]